MGLGIATGVKCANNPPIQITYLGTNGTGLSIGPARPDRIIVAIGYGENDAGGAMSSCTFSGSAGTIIYNPTISDSFGMAYKVVSSGTSCDVSISQFGFIRAEYYMITGIKAGYHGGSSGSSSGTSLGITVGTPAQECALIMGSRSRSSNGSFNAYATGGTTGMTLNHGFNHAGGGNPSCWASSGYGDRSGSNVTATHSGSGAYDSGYGFCAVFK